MFCILILLVLSFNLNAEPSPNIHPVNKQTLEQDITQLKIDYKALSENIATLNNQVSASIDSNQTMVRESRILIEEVNKLMEVQSAQRQDFLDVMDKAKNIKDAKEDLSFSIASDEMAIYWNFGSALLIAIGSLFASLYVTFKVLTKSLASETNKHTQSLESNLAETKLLNKAQIDTQLNIARLQNDGFSKELEAKISISNAQLKTQLDSVSEQTKEAHALKIDEFRQLWINTFREDISVLIKSFVTLKHFHFIEESFFVSLDILKRAERSQRNLYGELLKEANSEKSLLKKVIAKSKIKNNDDYIISKMDVDDAKLQFKEYKNEYKEFNNLHAIIIEQKTKIMLMFNPNGTANEKKIVDKLNHIHQLLSTGERTFMPKGNIEAIDKAIIALQPLVQDMLKIEWNRVRRTIKATYSHLF
ncbi:hypothetical protein [Colwellia sp. MT41]|uniref:hypothetical protein n=1 Tax=Colwellia sp. MT41 TaxID=58049 RepID=UPI000B11418A|nr:hypothetical protein [Colwellia sp. MT41]